MKSLKLETIKKFTSKSYNESDLKDLFLWFNSKNGLNKIGDLFEENWNNYNNTSEFEVDSEKILTNIRNEIRLNKTIQLKKIFTRLLPYAAMVILIIGIATVFALQEKLSKDTISNFYASVITEKGQRTRVILPDSSIVWLNSETTLSYNFSLKNERRIFLNGEGFFQITRNEEKPLVVQSGAIEVKVLGTKFNFNSYPDNDKISVVLESGSVALKKDQSSKEYFLRPGEKADYYIKEQKIGIQTAEIKNYTSWKDGKLIFRNDPMKNVVKTLERWYNININVKDSIVYNSIFTGTIISESYQQIFKLIEYSCPVTCTIVNPDLKKVPEIIISSKLMK